MNKLLFIFILCSTQVMSEKLQILTVNEPPANYIDSKGELDGYVTEIIKKIQLDLNNPTKIITVPEARALSILHQESDVLFFSLSRTAEREDDFHWVGRVLIKKWQLYSIKGALRPINNINQLAALPIIGVVRGDVREKWLIDHGFTNIQSVTQHKQNIQLLAMGRVAAIVQGAYGLQFLCKELNIDPNSFESIYTLNTSEVYIAMSKKTPRKRFIPWRNAFNKLVENGEIEHIAQKWHNKLSQNTNIEGKVVEGILSY